MSALNGDEILLTFDELLQLENGDISACVDKYNALNICVNSSAPSSKIFNIWVQKLFKAYNLEEFVDSDWQRIIDYLNNIFEEFIKSFTKRDDTSNKELEQWLLDSQELVKWMAANIYTLDISILSLILTFVMEIILKTYSCVNKTNFKILHGLQRLVAELIHKFIIKIPIKDEEFTSFNKIVLSLSDVGSIIIDRDIALPPDDLHLLLSWNSVVTLCGKIHLRNQNISFTKIKNLISMEIKWNEKAIFGIIQKLIDIIRYYNENAETDQKFNLLKVTVLYFTLLINVINYSAEIIKPFPAVKELLEIFRLCEHDMKSRFSRDLVCITRSLHKILQLLYKDSALSEAIIQHIESDHNNSRMCELPFMYLETYIRYGLSFPTSLEVILKIYNVLVEGPFIFSISTRYKVLLHRFAALTIMDDSRSMHKLFCEYVVNSHWIRAYTSMDVLSLYYGYFLNKEIFKNIKLFEFWCGIWNEANKINDIQKFRQLKKLTEMLLNKMFKLIPDDVLQQDIFSKCENIEIILLKCGKQNERCLQFFNTNLVKNLKLMQEHRMNNAAYKELLNLLDICIARRNLVNEFLKETIFVTFTGLLSLPPPDIQKFNDFVNNCFIFFYLNPEEKKSKQLLKYLRDHDKQCCNIQSVFLVEFLLSHRPVSSDLIKALNTSNKRASKIIQLIGTKPSAKRSVDVSVLNELPQTSQQARNQSGLYDLEQIKKKPRIDEEGFSNVKFILNDLNVNTQKLLNIPRSTFDRSDFELMKIIKNRIDKCLPN